MQGPNALTADLLSSYLRYLFSAHPVGIRNEALERDLRVSLGNGRALLKGPILELDPASRGDRSVAELISDGDLCDRFGDLPLDSSGTRLLDRCLYSHQVASIRASNLGKSVVVASGTGSGKSEAWFYPVVSELLKNPSSGLRAIVLYPMNALADDQRRARMRNLLRDTEITYGEYTGNTPQGDHEKDQERLDSDAPRNELQTRRQMREAPPNILITNPSMLEYLLLRPEDNMLFTGSRLQYLILDEAHTYRGAYGIELGHLVRRLKARLGIASGELRSFVLSATIDRTDLEAICRFASNLTGEAVSTEHVFFGEPEVLNPVATPSYRPSHAYECFNREAVAAILKNPEAVISTVGSDFGEDRLLSAARYLMVPKRYGSCFTMMGMSKPLETRCKTGLKILRT